MRTGAPVDPRGYPGGDPERLAAAVRSVISFARSQSWSGRADATDWELVMDARALTHVDIDDRLEDGTFDADLAEAHELVRGSSDEQLRRCLPAKR